MQGNLFIISAPSGAGKTSLVRALVERDRGCRLSVSYTTRAPRPGERDGVDYYFVDDAEFLAMLERGDFIEHALVYGNRYGTSGSRIAQLLGEGVDLIFEIDWQGARTLRERYAEAASIFVLPPSTQALLERLRARGQDSDEVIARRLAAAQADMEHVGEFEYVIINKDFATALSELQSIVATTRLRYATQRARHAQLFTDLGLG